MCMIKKLGMNETAERQLMGLCDPGQNMNAIIMIILIHLSMTSGFYLEKYFWGGGEKHLTV